MGLFQKWNQYRDNQKQKRIAKYKRMVAEPKAVIRDERVAAIEYFCSLDDYQVAVPALLARFEYSLEHGIYDSKEKERALQGIVKHGDQVIDLLKEHLKKTSKIAWPIKALEAVASDEETVVDVLKSCINFNDDDFNQKQIDKNYDVLCYLREYKLGDYTNKIIHFLKSHDERLRFAALEIVIEQEDEAYKKNIEVFLKDKSSENTRLRQLSIEAFLKYNWQLQNLDAFPDKLVVPGVRVGDDGRLTNH